MHRLQSQNVVLRVVHADGNLNNGANAGVACRNVNNRLSNSNTNNGAQLTFLMAEAKPYLLVKHNKLQMGVSSSMQKLSNEKAMKRLGNIYFKVYDKDNIRRAFINAMKGKAHYGEVREIKKNFEWYVDDLHKMLKQKKYTNSKYTVFTRHSGGKERKIYMLPFYPDRVVHHCIVQVVGEAWEKTLIYDTYSTIPGRGPHLCAKKIKSLLRNQKWKYCLKLDINKYYPSVNNEILKTIIRKKIKDKHLLAVLDNIIDSANGIPIGNYVSQWFGNLYLNDFDHWVKETLGAKNYFRYCDDLVFIAQDKQTLWMWLDEIKSYLKSNLELSIKDNYQVFPVSRGIDFLGFRFFNGYTLVRKRILKAMKQRLHKPKSKASYFGWLVHADSFRLTKKYFTEGYAIKHLSI